MPHLVLEYEILSETNIYQLDMQEIFTPNFYVDISNTLENKLSAFKKYKSQIQLLNQPRSIESIKNLAIAQMKMQKELRNLDLNAQGFGYKYASLDHLLNYARKMCSKYGLSFVQNPIGTETTIGVETIYMHESGEFLVGNLESPIGGMKGKNVYQSSGAAITYLRRYSLI